jgi:hypothetical protein
MSGGVSFDNCGDNDEEDDDEILASSVLEGSFDEVFNDGDVDLVFFFFIDCEVFTTTGEGEISEGSSPFETVKLFKDGDFEELLLSLISEDSVV